MKCSDIKNQFLDYLDDNLDNKAKKLFETHIKRCEQCSNELSQLGLLNKKLSKVKNIETPRSLSEEFLSAIDMEQRKFENRIFRYENLRFTLKIAASIILFIAGLVFGVLISNSGKVNTRVAKLENEVSRLEEAVTVAVFNEHTTSQKIKAVYYFDDQSRINPALIKALTNALNNDDNINVRITAAKSLFRYNNIPEVRELLIKSLVNQNEPMVQILIIDHLVAINEKGAAESLKGLVNSNNTNNIVKQYAARGLKTLL